MTISLDDLSVLLVEDEFLILLDLEDVLAEAGARVTTATSVAEAHEALGARFDVAVLDVRLPDGEVFPVAHRLAAQGVPLVFHSGHAQAEGLGEAFPGAVALGKPARESLLISAVARQAEGRIGE